MTDIAFPRSFGLALSKMASMISGENLSDISFKRKKIEKEVVGVVYVVTNDYHTQKESALRDHGAAGWRTMDNFLNSVKIEGSDTSKNRVRDFDIN